MVLDDASYDVLVIGAGTAGLPCAIEAARAGARVLLVDKADRIGGTLHVSGGHLAAAGTRRQRSRGIVDHPDDHYADVMRLGDDAADPVLLRRAVDLAAGVVDWLDDLGLDQPDDSPRIVHGHEPYATARTHYGSDEARSILALLEPLLDQEVAAGRIVLSLGTRLVDLVVVDGIVTGAQLERAGERVIVSAPAVVLATGGYAAAPELFRELEGLELHSSAPETSTGDGLVAGRAAGGTVVRTGTFIPTFGGLPDPGRPGRTLWMPRPHLVATERPPWELYVGTDGRRFVAEDEPSIDTKERRLLDHLPDLTFHVVIDQRGLREGGPLLLGAEPDAVAAWVDQRDGFVSADTIERLADKAGIDRDGLVATVADYNERVRSGEPDPFGRTHRPAEIAEPPFVAIRNHGATLITFAGLSADAEFAVLDADGGRVPGLYAIGEVLGAGATMGTAFCGGMTLTPALAFGRDLGQRLGRELGVGPAPHDLSTTNQHLQETVP